MCQQDREETCECVDDLVVQRLLKRPDQCVLAAGFSHRRQVQLEFEGGDHPSQLAPDYVHKVLVLQTLQDDRYLRPHLRHMPCHTQ